MYPIWIDINMKPFRIWIEQSLRRDSQEKVQKIYDMTVKQLLGSAKDQYHLALSDIEDDAAEHGQPPAKKGAMAVLDKLNGIQVFNRLQSLGDTNLARQAQETQTWLSTVANDQKIGSKGTVGELLNRLFGKDATETYGKRTWQSQATAPQNNDLVPQQPPQNSPPAPEMPPEPQTQQQPQTPMMTPDMMGTGPLQTPNGPMPPKPPMF